MAQSMARHAVPPSPHRRWWFAVPVLAVAVPVALMAWDVVQAAQAARSLQSNAALAQNAVSERDLEALRQHAAALSDDALAFASHTDGPLWDLAAKVPWLEDQVLPVQAAAGTMVVLADDVLAPLGQGGTLAGLEMPEVVDGRLDPFALEPYRTTLESAAQALEQQELALAAVDTSQSVSQVADALAELSSQVKDLRPTVEAAALTAQLLPTLAGGEGERHYVVMVQNNAEPRALGGIPGAVMVLTVDDGRFELGEYFSAGELNNAAGSPISIREDELALFTERIQLFSQNATFTPEFPRAAQVIMEFVERATGQSYDGVISLDPVALSYLLEGAPAQQVGVLEVSGDSLAQVMLNGAYFAYANPKEQDAFFEAAAGMFFDDVLAGGAGMIPALERAMTEGRFAMWSAHEDEQILLDGTALSPNFLEAESAAGVFLNDGSASKIGYYLDLEVRSAGSVCTVGDASLLEVTVTHTFTGDPAALPEYIGGTGEPVPVGHFGGNILVYAPSGYLITAVTLDGEDAATRTLNHAGRLATEVWVALEPGQSASLTYTLVKADAAALWDVIVVTPMALTNAQEFPLVLEPNSC